MPTVDKQKLLALKANYTDYPAFIETGTLNGQTTFAMEPFFEKVYTIEVSTKYHAMTKSKYSGTKIEFLLGDSSIVFPSLLPQIQTKAIFFLDGHWSSGDTGRSMKDCPLLEELLCITESFKQEAILIIDDCRLFGKSQKTGNNEDWSEITKENILRIVMSRVTDLYYFDTEYAKEDQMIIHLGPKDEVDPA